MLHAPCILACLPDLHVGVRDLERRSTGSNPQGEVSVIAILESGMIIFGWGQDFRVMGEVGLIECNNCHNTASWLVVETKKKATLYFVPVAKWQHRYFCICPVCKSGVELIGKEQAQDLLLKALEQRETARIQIGGLG